MNLKTNSSRTKISLLSGLLLLSAGCCASGGEGADDLSWIGGLIGTAIGFGLFFLVVSLSARAVR